MSIAHVSTPSSFVTNHFRRFLETETVQTVTGRPLPATLFPAWVLPPHLPLEHHPCPQCLDLRPLLATPSTSAARDASEVWTASRRTARDRSCDGSGGSAQQVPQVTR